jgi:serine/threonine protein phosphatase PrpC
LFSLTSWSLSDIGQVRTNNEDAFFDDCELGLFMVADGMGGHRGGDRASKIAIEEALKSYKTNLSLVGQILALELAILQAAKAVFQTSLKEYDLRGMGTTLSALAITDNIARIAHIGDTRIYCCREGKLYQLTRDHSLVNEKIEAGLMTKEEARISSLRHIITRAIGHHKEVQADYFSLPIQKNDLFLLCTDGLNNMLSDNELVDIINKLPPKKAVKKMIFEANKNGGDDNITVILVKANK